MKNKIIKNTGIILGCSIAAKLLSYIWEAILAAYLGVSDQADALYMTLSVYNIIYPILNLGIWKVFLPAYKSKLTTGTEEEAEGIANTAVTLFLVISFALVLFLILFAKPIIFVIASGFSPEKKAITEHYLMITAGMYLLMATSAVIAAVLQSRGRFFGSQVRELGTHIAKIVFIALTFRYLGIYAALIAYIFGSIARLLIQLPFINWKWRFRLDFRFKKPEVRAMLKGLPSVSITAAIAHIHGLVDKMIASWLMTGAVAYLNYGSKLTHVFSGMISGAIGTATYPTMIQHIAKKEDGKLRTLLMNTISMLTLLIVPISCFCVTFARDIVTAAFQRGAFDATASELTAGVFGGYCIGILFTGVSTIVTNVFYGYGDTKKTMMISAIGIVLNVALNLVLIRIWGVAGLAIATSISSFLSLGIRMVLLRQYVCLDYRHLGTETLKILLLSAASVAVTFLLTKLVPVSNVYLRLILCCASALILFLGASFLVRIEAMDMTIRMLKNRFLKR